MSSLNTIAQSLVDRLAPLRDVGLTVRRTPNRIRQQGVISGNGLLTISLDSITGGATNEELAGVRQMAPQVWLLSGLLRNVRQQDGVNNFYDYLTERLFGWVPQGASGPVSLTSFSTQPPTEDYLVVEMRVSIPAILVANVSNSLLIDEVPEANGSNLLEAIFVPTEITDRWGVYSDTSEVNPC